MCAARQTNLNKPVDASRARMSVKIELQMIIDNGEEMLSQAANGACNCRPGWQPQLSQMSGRIENDWATRRGEDRKRKADESSWASRAFFVKR